MHSKLHFCGYNADRTDGSQTYKIFSALLSIFTADTAVTVT